MKLIIIDAVEAATRMVRVEIACGPWYIGDRVADIYADCKMACPEEMEGMTKSHVADYFRNTGRPEIADTLNAVVCPDCGDRNELRGHQTCQYPSNA